MTTRIEWSVDCPQGHRVYLVTEDISPESVQFTDCPTCGSPRTGYPLDPVPPPTRPGVKLHRHLLKTLRSKYLGCYRCGRSAQDHQGSACNGPWLSVVVHTHELSDLLSMVEVPR